VDIDQDGNTLYQTGGPLSMKRAQKYTFRLILSRRDVIIFGTAQKERRVRGCPQK
jgi:hypothetical protein